MPLPSLTSYHVQGLTIDDEERDLEWHLHPHESNIANLAFIRCTIGEKELSEVLETTKRLSFSAIAPSHRRTCPGVAASAYCATPGIALRSRPC